MPRRLSERRVPEEEAREWILKQIRRYEGMLRLLDDGNIYAYRGQKGAIRFKGLGLREADL